MNQLSGNTVYSTTPIIRTLDPGLTLDFKDENYRRSVLAFSGNPLKLLQWSFPSFNILNFCQTEYSRTSIIRHHKRKLCRISKLSDYSGEISM